MLIDEADFIFHLNIQEGSWAGNTTADLLIHATYTCLKQITRWQWDLIRRENQNCCENHIPFSHPDCLKYSWSFTPSRCFFFFATVSGFFCWLMALAAVGNIQRRDCCCLSTQCRKAMMQKPSLVGKEGRERFWLFLMITLLGEDMKIFVPSLWCK